MKMCQSKKPITKKAATTFTTGNIYRMRSTHKLYKRECVGCTPPTIYTILFKDIPYIFTNECRLVNLITGMTQEKPIREQWYDDTESWCIQQT